MADRKKFPVVEEAQITVTAYKGFDKSLSCRGMQFEIGGTFEQAGKIESCKNGLHACKHPLSVFEFYPPATSRYAEVICAGEICDKGTSDTKIAAAKITVTVELSVGDLVKRAWDYVWSRSTLEEASATGARGAASVSGKYGHASASGPMGKVMAAGDMQTLFAREFDDDGHLLSIACGIVGKGGIKAGVWYCCKAGELVEVQP